VDKVWVRGKSGSKTIPSTPDGVRVYAIGDIHGRADLLQKLMTKVDDDLSRYPTPGALEVYLGDYVDRGPASRKVIDLLCGRARLTGTVFLKGNHESYLSGFLENPAILCDWRLWGGLETLLSYGVVASLNPTPDQQAELSASLNRRLPTAHREWLSRLRPSFTCGDYFFVHAGVRPGVPLTRQVETDLLTIREDFLQSEEQFEKFIVHGHTPVHEPEFRPNRINIDTGAYATGRLTCLVLDGTEMHLLDSRSI
jgi:serine/threonine protein phosphatase 1